MVEEKEFIELKANQKAMCRALYNSDQHFDRLDNNVLEIKGDIIKLNHAIFGNGTRGLRDTVDLIFQKVSEIEKNCATHSSCRRTVEAHSEILESYDSLVKGAKGVIFMFKMIGVSTIAIILLYVIKALISFLGGFHA
jgi:predicted  nucleic acid-binding Zn-ribbon protein